MPVPTDPAILAGLERQFNILQATTTELANYVRLLLKERDVLLARLTELEAPPPAAPPAA